MNLERAKDEITDCILYLRDKIEQPVKQQNSGNFANWELKVSDVNIYTGANIDKLKVRLQDEAHTVGNNADNIIRWAQGSKAGWYKQLVAWCDITFDTPEQDDSKALKQYLSAMNYIRNVANVHQNTFNVQAELQFYYSAYVDTIDHMTLILEFRAEVE